jgi:hypothetical protein
LRRPWRLAGAWLAQLRQRIVADQAYREGRVAQHTAGRCITPPARISIE